ERAEAADVGLRVFIGKQMAMVSSADTSPEALDELAARAVDMAKAVPADPHAGLADPDQLAANFPELDLADESEPDEATLAARAAEAEEAALAVKGVENSEGADASYSESTVAMVATNGFSHSYHSTGSSIAASVIAGTGEAMETDYDYTRAIYGSDLRAAKDVGTRAAERAVARLGARKAQTGQVPVVYDQRVSSSLVSHLLGAINGSSIARGTSFLKDRMGDQLFRSEITIIDDPHIKRGLRSKPVDSEGLANGARALIDEGRLTTWLLDLRSARQLGLASTGHAARGITSPPSPSPTNIALMPGEMTPEELIADIEEGFLVTSMMGSSVSLVTGDYSRGASGFWIEKGKITFPVNEVTVAGNLSDMFARLIPANDLERKTGIDAPTIRIDGMTVAGI
ncbi:MAG: metallopeptidase TldD-related protein, partial [Pseudomonadota bacterium]